MILLTGGSNSFCSSSYNHISTANRFLIKLIWCDPYLAVKNFSLLSLTSPFSVKLTRSPVRPGDRSQSFIVSTPHCIFRCLWIWVSWFVATLVLLILLNCLLVFVSILVQIDYFQFFENFQLFVNLLNCLNSCFNAEQY
jgi:hypothetical protein